MVKKDWKHFSLDPALKFKMCRIFPTFLCNFEEGDEQKNLIFKEELPMPTASNFRLCWAGSYPVLPQFRKLLMIAQWQHRISRVTQYLAQHFTLACREQWGKPSRALRVNLPFGCSSILNATHSRKWGAGGGGVGEHEEEEEEDKEEEEEREGEKLILPSPRSHYNYVSFPSVLRKCPPLPV